jgi:hypothetical protein
MPVLLPGFPRKVARLSDDSHVFPSRSTPNEPV